MSAQATQPPCKPSKDFLRHIANPRIAEALLMVDEGKALNVKGEEGKRILQRTSAALSEVKKGLANAEAKNDFSVYGGNPVALADYLRSPTWKELVQNVYEELRDSADAWNFVKSVIEQLLKDLAESYRSSCGEVSKAAEETLSWVETLKPAQQVKKPEEAGGEQS